MKEPDTVLAPSSAWNLDYADDSCRLMRMFGESENRVAFYIERYGPGDGFEMVIAGRPLGRTNRSTVDFRFGPSDDPEPRRREVALGDFGEFKPAWIFSGVTLLRIDGEDSGHRDFRDDFDPEEAGRVTPGGYDILPEAEQRIEWLDAARAGSSPVRLQLGSMGSPMAALRKCTDDLLTRWGIDVAAHEHLQRHPVPASNPAEWLQSSDYPTGLLRQGAQGLVKIRLSVDKSGRPTQCHIQRSTRPEGFDAVVCDRLMERARFEPALGPDGQPIASYWRSTVRFIMP